MKIRWFDIAFFALVLVGGLAGGGAGAYAGAVFWLVLVLMRRYRKY